MARRRSSKSDFLGAIRSAVVVLSLAFAGAVNAQTAYTSEGASPSPTPGYSAPENDSSVGAPGSFGPTAPMGEGAPIGPLSPTDQPYATWPNNTPGDTTSGTTQPLKPDTTTSPPAQSSEIPGYDLEPATSQNPEPATAP